MNSPEAIKALGALAQESRLGIYRLLVQQGSAGLTVGTIGESMDMAGATLSFHLKELSLAGLVSARQDGRFIYYAANYDAMGRLLAYLSENCCQGEACAVACEPKAVPRRKRA